jgi:hypothetical protein
LARKVGEAGPAVKVGWKVDEEEEGGKVIVTAEEGEQRENRLEPQ